eukprot:scaffold229832_cov23-Cyclotella_meneghiniana.AAC.1
MGDMVVLSTGDCIPADVRLIDSVEMMVDESSLTGENSPAWLPSMHNGGGATAAVHGTDQCGIHRGLVISVGEQTEFGKVAKELSEVEERKSPLEVKIDELGRLLAYASSHILR